MPVPKTRKSSKFHRRKLETIATTMKIIDTNVITIMNIMLLYLIFFFGFSLSFSAYTRALREINFIFSPLIYHRNEKYTLRFKCVNVKQSRKNTHTIPNYEPFFQEDEEEDEEEKEGAKIRCVENKSHGSFN